MEGGNNLLIDEVHNPRRIVPEHVAPLILLGAVVTHIFGGSVGREGTAVQMGSSFAGCLTRLFSLAPADRRISLMTGISAGLTPVSGTPLAGAVFGLEVFVIDSLRYNAILPCFIAAIVDSLAPSLLDVHHTPYAIPFMPYLTPITIGLVVMADIVFDPAGMTFAALTHQLSRLLKYHAVFGPFRLVLGGSVVVAAALALGMDRYLSLDTPVIVDAFHTPLPAYDFAGKMTFTIVTLASGFKGGEVTPLLYIGATLGNALGYMLPLLFLLLADLGFVAVFTGTANTPIASTLMVMGLSGPEVGTFVGIACVAGYFFLGHTGICHTQHIGYVERSTEVAPTGQVPAESAEYPQYCDACSASSSVFTSRAVEALA